MGSGRVGKVCHGVTVACGDGPSPTVRPALLARTSQPRVKGSAGARHRVRGVQTPPNAAPEPRALVGLHLSHKVNFVIVAQGPQVHPLVVGGTGLLQEHAHVHLVRGPPALVVLPLPHDALAGSRVPGEDVSANSPHRPCGGEEGDNKHSHLVSTQLRGVLSRGFVSAYTGVAFLILPQEGH